MRGSILLGGGRSTAWTHNTGYVGVSGLHSENSPPVLGRRKKEDHNFNELLNVIENMHRKDMQVFTTNRRYLEKSMMAYSERMRGLLKGRRSLPVIITPASGEKPVLPIKKHSNVVRPDVASPSSDLLGSSRESPASSGRSPQLSPQQHFPRKLSPFPVHRSHNRKMTFHGSDIERHFLSPNMHPLRHSISGGRMVHSLSPNDATRTRKITTISPPDLYQIQRSRDTKSTDSAYESFNESEIDFEHRDKAQLDNKDAQYPSAVTISCFPDIYEARKHINSVLSVYGGTTDDTNNVPRKIKMKKKVKKPVESKQKKHKYSKRLRKAEKHEKEEIAETIIENLYGQEEDVEQEEAEEDDDTVDENDKKKREVCYGFRYSLAIKELLKKPNPFNVSKKEMVFKVEMENGRIVNTLGPAVLKVVDVDKLNNIRGVPLNIKREDPAGKRKKAQANLSKNVGRNTLPSISRGLSQEPVSEDMDRVTDVLDTSRSKTSLYEKPMTSSQQSASTVMVVGADG